MRTLQQTYDLIDAYVAERKAAGTYDPGDNYLITMVSLLGEDAAARYFPQPRGEPSIPVPKQEATR